MIPDSQKDDTGNTSVYTNYEGSDDETRIVSINNDIKPDELISGSIAIKPEDQRNQLSLEEEASQPEDDTKIIQEPDLTQMAPVNRITKPFETETGEKKKDEGIAMVTTPKSEKEHTRITLFNRYDYYPVVDLIGKGGFSRVYKAFDQKLSRWVALEIYKTSEFSDRYSPIAEIKRVINLDHSNICRYLDIEEIEKVNPFGETEKIQVCVMELLDSGNFSEYFNNTGRDLNVMKKLLQDVLHGISYLHKNGIIHRDIKPANILIKKTVEGPVAKITDFGISKLSDSVNNNTSSALIVSIPYMAPEQLNAKKYGINEKISSNLDLWSLGVTIYEVITGKVLFKNNEQDSSEQIMANIMAPELPDKINELSEPFRTIVTYCMIKNANERAQKTEELLVILNSSGKLEPAVPIIPAQPSETIIKTASPVKAPYNEEIKKTENSISIPEKPDEQVSKRKIRIALDSPEIEKRAKKQISVLKICIAAASVLLLIASFFYFTVSNNEKKSTNKITDKDSTRRPSLVLPGKSQTDGSKKSENVNTK
jgi:serine/threonine protein kinase